MLFIYVIRLLLVIPMLDPLCLRFATILLSSTTVFSGGFAISSPHTAAVLGQLESFGSISLPWRITFLLAMAVTPSGMGGLYPINKPIEFSTNRLSSNNPPDLPWQP